MNAFIGTSDMQSGQCFKDKPVYTGLDNTFTSFADEGACYALEIDGGAVPDFEIGPQPAGLSGWTAQINWIVGEITAAAAAVGYEWVVEALFVRNGDPSDLNGIDTIPGPPTEAIAALYLKQGMSWRFIQISVCPGSPSPTRWKRTKGGTIYAGNADEERDLLITKPLPGPIRDFWVCFECGKSEGSLAVYLATGAFGEYRRLDPNEPADRGQLPRCLVPCGAAAQIQPPTSPTCQFQNIPFCDVNNILDNDINGDPIYQEGVLTYQWCDGQQLGPFPTIAQEQPDGSFAQVEYEPAEEPDYRNPDNKNVKVGDPQPPCDDFVSMGNIWRLEGDPDPGTLVEWWAGANAPGGGNSAPHDTPSLIFTNDGSTLLHPNGAPYASYVSPTINFVTSQAAFYNGMGVSGSAETNGTDQVKLSGYLVLLQSALLADTNDNTGERGGIWLNECCENELVNLFERSTDSVGGDARMFNNVRVPAGIHYFEIVTSDLSAWQGAQLSVSFDDGATYEPFVGYTTKPMYKCRPVLKCKDTGVLVDALSGDAIELNQFDSWCEPKGCTGTSGSTEVTVEPAPYNGPTAEEIAAANIAAERDVTPQVMNFTNEGGVESLRDAAGNVYPAGTFGRIDSIQDIGTGFVRWSIDGSTPTTQEGNGFTTSGPYHYYGLENVDLSLVRLDGSSANSDFSISFVEYNA